jgi:hypothetical protein
MIARLTSEKYRTIYQSSRWRRKSPNTPPGPTRARPRPPAPARARPRSLDPATASREAAPSRLAGKISRCVVEVASVDLLLESADAHSLLQEPAKMDVDSLVHILGS